MSTRCNVVIKEYYTYDNKLQENRLYFYRHSDGYPEGVESTLMAFLYAVSNETIRNNLSQSSGWLVLLGAMEHNNLRDNPFSEENFGRNASVEDVSSMLYGWKVGSYEPTTCIHGDIEYLYEIDLMEPCISAYSVKKDWSLSGPDSQEFIHMFTVGPGKPFPVTKEEE